MVHAIVRMGNAGNGMPVFLISGQSTVLSRPFGATWDNDRHVWMYPAYYPAARKVLDDFKTCSKDVRFEFSDTASQYIRGLDDIERRYAGLELPSGFDFVTPPYAHQKRGLCHLFYFPRAALFYDPGLGKSKIAIDYMRLLRHLGDLSPVIVMGPLVTIRNWGAELDRHSGKGLRWGAVLGDKKKKTKVIESVAAGEADVLLVTYDTAKNFVDLIARLVNYKTVISDESHLIKSWSAARCKGAYEIAQKAPRRVIMTGTPTLGDPRDLYGQFKFLGDYFMPEAAHVFERRFVEHSIYNKHIVTGFKNLDVLNARTQFVSIRRRKDECLDLPERTFVDVEYWLSPHQAAIYNQLIEEMGIDVAQLLRMLGGEATDVMPDNTTLAHGAARLNKLMQVCSGFFIQNLGRELCDTAEVGGCRHTEECVKRGILPYTSRCQVEKVPPPEKVTIFKNNPKLDALEATLNSILADPEHKVIVWCSYRKELDLAEERIKTLLGEKAEYVRVDGTTGAKIQDAVDAFNDDPAVRVYLAQVSTGVGITLNAAAYVIYCSLPFSLGAYTQSLDRNHRIGQTRNVTVYRLSGKQTVEPAIVRLLDNKVDVDTVLASKLSCIVCEQSLKCIAGGIELFDPGCIYKRSMLRPTVKAYVIRGEDG